MAAANAFVSYDPASGQTEHDAAVNRYAENWGLYTGTAFSAVLENSAFSKPTSAYRGIYKNTRLVWKHIEATGDFYVATTYAGDIATDGKPLPNGTLGAIPIDPQVGDATDEANLRKAASELLTMWNWKAQMGLRPMYVSILADSMTRLVDDVERGTVYPEIVWPGYVKRVEVDFVGNVKAYVLEYQINQRKQNGETETFTYREEADKEAFRYFKSDEPWDRFGPGTAVTPNPYGFVPAIWDRFKVAPNSVRGLSAIDGTRQALYEVNSLFSHGIDHQRKIFFAPILVSGSVSRPGRSQVNVTQPPDVYAKREDETNWFAETFPVWPVGEKAAIHQAQFDIGDTELLLKMLQQGIWDENPEARFYPELRQMSQLTAPGAEMALGDAVSRVRRLRNNLDPGTKALIQMGIAIAGYRMSLAPEEGGWPRPFTQRQQAFAPFNLDSFKAGKLDFGILDRPVIVPSESDRLDLLLQKQSLNIPDEQLWREMGVEDKDITRWQADALKRAEAARVAFSRGDVPVTPGDDPQDPTEEEQA